MHTQHMKSVRNLFLYSRLFCVTYEHINSNHRVVCPRTNIAKIMAQTCITSFFKRTPLKASVKQESTEISEIETEIDSSDLSSNAAQEKMLKRQRLASSGSESQSPVKNTKKKKTQRQRIESSSSDSQSPTKINKAQSDSQLKSEVEITTKHKKSDVKTYESPKSKKVKLEKTKKIKESSVKINTSPINSSPTNIEDKDIADSIETNIPKLKKETSISKTVKKDEKEPIGKVAEAEYDPSKSKYDPISDACWLAGAEVPYLALARTLKMIEGTSARLKNIEILSNYFRSIIVLTPEDLLPSVYMCLNQLAPAYHSLELGIAETYLMKAIGQCTGRSVQQVREGAQRLGDLGAVAEQARAQQRTMFPAPPLTVRKLFASLKDIAHMTGHASVNKKINKIQSLYVACRDCEAKYLIRSLEGKLRIGLAEQSVLQALALATALTPPGPERGQVLDASKGVSPDKFKAVVEEHAAIIKTTYCECPNYEELVPALLRHGVRALPDHCRLTPGVPLKPMLAHPTRGVHEVFNRFEKESFTCEWKYDGERAQIHVPGDQSPDLARAAIFSRNQEDNTTKYPDVLARLRRLLRDDVTSCVLDCEAVAYDTQNKQILPFQVLSTRKRKDASVQDIKVQVCVFVFDLLYLNGRALVREPLAARRQLLHRHFNQVDGEWQFATSKDCSSMEEVQQFLEEAVRGSCEGLMVKTLTGENARYDIARRSHNWLKLKKDYLEGAGDTLDLVVIGAYLGKGKRAGVYGGFLLACFDADTEQYQSLCKLGTGFSDDDLQRLSEQLRQHVIDAPRTYYRYDESHAPDVWVSAHCVWEVRCADLSLSPAHRAAQGLVDPAKGISLRFPRFVRERDDKAPEQATSAQQVAAMYRAQDQVKNQSAKNNQQQDDFY